MCKKFTSRKIQNELFCSKRWEKNILIRLPYKRLIPVLGKKRSSQERSKNSLKQGMGLQLTFLQAESVDISIWTAFTDILNVVSLENLKVAENEWRIKMTSERVRAWKDRVQGYLSCVCTDVLLQHHQTIRRYGCLRRYGRESQP